MDHGGCGEAAAAVIQYEGDHGCGDEVVAAIIRANWQSRLLFTCKELPHGSRRLRRSRCCRNPVRG
jgi:hypothetical protein